MTSESASVAPHRSAATDATGATGATDATGQPPMLGGVGWSVLLSLLVLAVLGGFRPLIGPLSTWFAPLLFPAAAGLPALWPPLRVSPLGESTVTLWLVDLAGVAVMLLAAWIQLRAASRRHPTPRRARAFGRAVGVTVIAVIAGNIVRSVAQSFLLRTDLGTYIGQLLATILVAAVIGALLGLLVGVVAALVPPGGRR